MQDASVVFAEEQEDLSKNINLVLSQLNEKQKRLVVGLLARMLGWGGQSTLSQISGMDRKTIRQGSQELQNDLADCPTDRIRREGAGRPPIEKKLPRWKNV